MYKSLILFLVFSFLGCASNKNTYQSSMKTFRDEYKKGFLNDPRSPLTKEDLHFLDFYPIDQQWNLDCSCTKILGAKPFELPTYSGVTRTYIVHSDVSCLYKGQSIKFKLYKNITQPINPLYKNNLFLPFKDLTNGETTYGGGRYINLLESDIVDGKINIDFNKCYNPWCAYSDGYNCPIPPKENHFDIEVIAGERNYKGMYKKK
jgi:hypothetical protein